MIVVHVKNDKSGLECLNAAMTLFPNIKKENVVDALRQGYDLEPNEMP